MESHPEEFDRHEDIYGDRWSSIVADILEYGNQDDISAVRAALRDIRLGEAHEDMMDELLNGDDRRRKEESDREYEKQLTMQMHQQMQQTSIYQNQAGTYRSALGIGNVTPSHPLVINSPNGTEAMRITANGQLNIGGETLDAGIIKKIKGALKI
jgi:hypothetical protein